MILWPKTDEIVLNYLNIVILVLYIFDLSSKDLHIFI